MADTKISAMAAAAALAGTERVPIVQTAANVAATIDQFGDRVQSRFGLVLDNLSATTDPVVGSDSSAGYSIGSMWFNRTTDVVWIARDVSVGAAVWVNAATGFGPAGGESAAWITGMHSTNGAQTVVANVHYATLFFLKQRTTFSRLGAYADTASGNIKAGFFTNKAGGLCPDVYVAGSETVIATASTSFSSTAIGTGNITLDAGPWWFDFIATGTPALRGTGVIDPLVVSLLGADTGNEVRQTSTASNQTCRELAGSYATGLNGVSLAAATRGPGGASGGATGLIWAKMA